MSKVEGGGVRLTPLKATCNYFFFKASRVNIMTVECMMNKIFIEG